MKGTETGEKRRLFSSWFYFAGNLEGDREENKKGDESGRKPRRRRKKETREKTVIKNRAEKKENEMEEIRTMLEKVAAGEMTVEDAVLELKKEPFTAAGFDDLGFAKLDTHRKLRQGAAEVIYGAGKTAEQIAGIVEAMKKRGQQVILITRLDKEKAERTASLLGTPLSETPSNGAPLSKTLLHGPQNEVFRYFSDAQIGLCGEFPKKDGVGTIVVATGGTSDIPVAEEAALTAEALGNQVERLYDVGVAGLHRLMAHMDSIMSARVIIAIAGMEGALASVIGGLADCPVIAVPTSIGYGASFHGVSALLSMLNSCASGVSVVNIDNGFGAGYLASMINHLHDPVGAPKH